MLILNLFKRYADKSLGSYGQAAIEFIFVLPFLFLLMLWTFQFFYAIHTASVNQKFARAELLKSMDHYRDLRDAEEFKNKNPNFDFSNDGFWMDYMSRGIYVQRFENEKTYFAVSVTGTPGGNDVPQRLIGDPGETPKYLNMRTTVGICRDERCE